MARMTFRPFQKTEADYKFLADLWNENYPNQPESARQIRFGDDSWDADYVHERYFGELEGRPAASATLLEPFWSYQPGKYFFSFMLRKDRQGMGLEAEVLDFLLDRLALFDPKMLTTSAREDEFEKLSLLDSYGFKLTMRYPQSFLDVPAFDLEPYEGLREKLEAEGIQVATAAELAEFDPDFNRKWYELEWEIAQDVPSPDPPTKLPFEQFLKWRQSPTFLPQAIFFALEQAELVGTSGLWRNDARESHLTTGLTGVKRSHRRRGIATMLKIEGIRFAKQHGVEKIETDNEETNPMFQINLRLGFEPAPAWMDFEKSLDRPSEL